MFWLDSEQLAPSTGVARALVREPGQQEFIDLSVDPRDAWLRVTTADGDRYARVAEVLSRLIDGSFTIDLDEYGADRNPNTARRWGGAIRLEGVWMTTL